jgi:AcrR family transcriptional regulator
MTASARRPGPDSTLKDVRAKLIDAGAKLLRERGAELGLSSIPLSDVINEAGVTRSTSYRSLAHEELAPQVVLHQEILTQLLTRYSRATTRHVINAVIADKLEQYEHTLATGSPAERTAALRAIIRVGTNTSYQNVIEAPERALLTAVYGSLRSSPASPDWRHEALSQGELSLNTMFCELYAALTALFGYQVREPLTIEQFAAAGVSLVEGIAMRHGFNDEVTMIDRPTGPDGAIEEWSLFAVAFEALFIGFCEPMDPTTPFADLTRY